MVYKMDSWIRKNSLQADATEYSFSLLGLQDDSILLQFASTLKKYLIWKIWNVTENHFWDRNFHTSVATQFPNKLCWSHDTFQAH